MSACSHFSHISKTFRPWLCKSLKLRITINSHCIRVCFNYYQYKDSTEVRTNNSGTLFRYILKVSEDNFSFPLPGLLELGLADVNGRQSLLTQINLSSFARCSAFSWRRNDQLISVQYSLQYPALNTHVYFALVLC